MEDNNNILPKSFPRELILVIVRFHIKYGSSSSTIARLKTSG